MHTLEVRFTFPTAPGDDAVAAASDLLDCWYRNGQSLAKEWPLAVARRTVVSSISTPESTSLSPRQDNGYACKARQTLRARFKATIRVTLLGRDPESPGACGCTTPSALILYTSYADQEGAVRCADCFRSVPLYRLPPQRDGDYHGILQWRADYRACDALQMRTRVGERFAEAQLQRLDSALTRCGLEICREFTQSTQLPVYYYLHRSRGSSLRVERGRKCPGCGGDWLLERRWHHVFDFRCDNCRLLADVACSLSH